MKTNSCRLAFIVSDDATGGPATIPLALVKVDNIVVTQYQNDIVNPAMISTGLASGGVAVACGVTHVVKAYIARNPTTTYEQIGALQPIKCPTAP